MSNNKLRELPVPPIVKTDPNSFEIGRIWVAHKDQHVSLNIVWDDPAAWGIMLVDLARHAARYYNQQQGHPIEKIMARIKEGIDAEWDTPTTDITGAVMDKPPHTDD